MQLLFFQLFDFIQAAGNRVVFQAGDFVVQLVVLFEQTGKMVVFLLQFGD